MPIYPYRCINQHYWEVYSTSFQSRPKDICPSCRKEGFLVYTPPMVNGGMFSDKTRELLSVPFGKKRARNFRDSKDVERALDEFHQKYPHLPRPEQA